MRSSWVSLKMLKIAAFTAVALSLGACSKDPTAGDLSASGAGAQTPGSIQGFRRQCR